MSTDDFGRDLARGFPDDPGHLRALHGRLAAAAEQAGLLDVAYRTIDTPVGPLLLAATERGLVRVAYASENHAGVLQTLAERISPRVLNAPGRLDPAATELDEYFAGRRRRFDLPLDWQLSAGFRRTVLASLAVGIGYGHTASYAALAELAGHPKAARAVGTACATNPLPVVVPCHRVVRADGGVGGYVGGTDAKRILLTLEAAAPSLSLRPLARLVMMVPVVVRMIFRGGSALTGRVGRHSTAGLAVVAAASLAPAQLEEGVGRSHPHLGHEGSVVAGPVGHEGAWARFRPRFLSGLWHDANVTANVVLAPGTRSAPRRRSGPGRPWDAPLTRFTGMNNSDHQAGK